MGVVVLGSGGRGCGLVQQALAEGNTLIVAIATPDSTLSSETRIAR